MTLALEEVVRRVGRETHIHRTSLELASGSLNVLLGPTLAGKTSLMRLMAGLDRPSEGRVLVDGADVTELSVRRRNVAMVYQQFINYPSFTVYSNIASPLRRAGLGRDEVDRRVRDAARRMHIDDLLERTPAQLSGGQQQRTALARALVKGADLLLLDEPLVNLDYKLREELREDLRTIFAKGEAIVVYATTEPLEALLLGGNTIVVDEGRVLQTGATVEVYSRPVSARVGQIFSDPPMNTVAGTVEGDTAILGTDIRVRLTRHLAGLRPARYTFGARAHHLTLRKRRPDDVEIAGMVDLAEVNGSETFIHVAHSGTSWVVQEEGVHTIGIDQSATIYLDPGALYVFDESGRLVAAPAARPG
jgi:glycerol transport system ATP-binding protein